MKIDSTLQLSHSECTNKAQLVTATPLKVYGVGKLFIADRTREFPSKKRLKDFSSNMHDREESIQLDREENFIGTLR